MELLTLSEISLEKIGNIKQTKKFLESWKQDIQVKKANVVEIKEIYWNSPEDHVSILYENLKHGSIKVKKHDYSRK